MKAERSGEGQSRRFILLKQVERWARPGGLTPLDLFNETVSVAGLRAAGWRGWTLINTTQDL